MNHSPYADHKSVETERSNRIGISRALPLSPKGFAIIFTACSTG
jgi:hypothetical protein